LVGSKIRVPGTRVVKERMETINEPFTYHIILYAIRVARRVLEEGVARRITIDTMAVASLPGNFIVGPSLHIFYGLCDPIQFPITLAGMLRNDGHPRNQNAGKASAGARHNDESV
jgi:hypothetical protein